MDAETGPLSVQIEFSQSHLFFPNIVHWVLAILAVLILVVHRREIVATLRDWAGKWQRHELDVDRIRLIGTLVLVVAYFVLMERVGELFPNMGLGFLLMSIPFMFLLSLLYVHKVNLRKVLIMGANAVIVPFAAWYVLAELFFITLP